MTKSTIRFQLTMFSLLVLGAFVLFASRGFGKQNDVTQPEKSFSQVLGASTEQKPPTVQIPVQGKPVHMRIDSLGIDLPVVDGIYDTNSKTWNLSKDKAHFALITPELNNSGGNTFIYGHNRKEVFAGLSKIEPNAMLEITSENGLTFVYSFVSSIETSPYDDSLFRYTGAPIVTLQTCSGLWYQNRQLFTFKLEQIKQENGDVF